MPSNGKQGANAPNLFYEVIKTKKERKPNWKQSIVTIEISLRESLPCCDNPDCGKPANPIFVYGATDCNISFKLCLPCRNKMLQEQYIKIANRKAQIAIEKHKKKLAEAEEQMQEQVSRGMHR